MPSYHFSENLKFLKAQVADKPVLNKIILSSKMYWNYPKEWMAKWMDGLLLSDEDFTRQSIYKLQKSGQLIGLSAFMEYEKKYELTNLWLKPDFVGKGYGKFLLNETLKHITKKHKPIVLEADPNAEAFYASQDFTVIGQKESYPKGRFLPVMRRYLNEGL